MVSKRVCEREPLISCFQNKVCFDILPLGMGCNKKGWRSLLSRGSGSLKISPICIGSFYYCMHVYGGIGKESPTPTKQAAPNPSSFRPCQYKELVLFGKQLVVWGLTKCCFLAVQESFIEAYQLSA